MHYVESGWGNLAIIPASSHERTPSERLVKFCLHLKSVRSLGALLVNFLLGTTANEPAMTQTVELGTLCPRKRICIGEENMSGKNLFGICTEEPTFFVHIKGSEITSDLEDKTARLTITR